jgi:hypothetical protein
LTDAEKEKKLYIEAVKMLKLRLQENVYFLLPPRTRLRTHCYGIAVPSCLYRSVSQLLMHNELTSTILDAHVGGARAGLHRKTGVRLDFPRICTPA